MMFLEVPPRLLLVKTKHGEVASNYVGKLETIPSDLFGLIQHDFEPAAMNALYPVMLDVSEPISGEMALYEFVCLILLGIATFNGARFLLWRNSDRHPVAKALSKFGNWKHIAQQINSEGADAATVANVTITKSWMMFPKPFDVAVVRLLDCVWAYESKGTGESRKPGGVCIWTKDGRLTELPISAAGRVPCVEALVKRAPWMFAGYDPKRWLVWKTNRQEIIDEVERRRRDLEHR